MLQASARFLAALKTGSYQTATKVSLLKSGVPLVLPAQPLISSATVTMDRSAAQLRRLALILEAIPGTLTGALMPTAATSPAAPFGNELQVFSGITFADGTTEYMSLGVFAISTTVIEDTGTNLTVTINGYDRSWAVSIRKFLTPYNVASGTDFATAITSLVGSVYSGLQYNIAPTPGAATTPAATFKEGDDPWAAAQTLAAACGMELFFDTSGTVVGRPIPTFTSVPTSWTVAEGTATGPTRVVNKFTRDGISNDFTVSGTGTPNAASGPVRATAKDTNPSNPTYVSGAFGDIPTFTTSSLVTTTGQAQNAATNALAASLGAAQLVTVDICPNPLLDLDDVIAVIRLRAGLSRTRVIVDQLKHTVHFGDVTTVIGRVTL